MIKAAVSVYSLVVLWEVIQASRILHNALLARKLAASLATIQAFALPVSPTTSLPSTTVAFFAPQASPTASPATLLDACIAGSDFASIKILAWLVPIAQPAASLAPTALAHNAATPSISTATRHAWPSAALEYPTARAAFASLVFT